MQQFYSIKNSERLDPLLQEIDLLRKKIDEKKPLDLELWSAIQAKLRIEWTFDTNALEGSTLTYGETLFFLNEGLTVEGRPFKDFLDARNHAEAIEYLYDVIKKNRPVSQGLIKEFNRLLLSGITHTAALDEFGQKVKKPATPANTSDCRIMCFNRMELSTDTPIPCMSSMKWKFSATGWKPIWKLSIRFFARP